MRYLVVSVNAQRYLCVLVLPFVVGSLEASDALTDAELTFFESKIRPVLAKHCVECHGANPKKIKGELDLSTKAGVKLGGESGAVINSVHPDKSLIIEAVRYTNPDLGMPPKGKLPDHIIQDIEKWVAMGAPDPRDEMAKVAQEDQIDIEAGRQFWAFQPAKRHPVPTVKNQDWVRDDIDRFIANQLEKLNVRPASDADRHTWLRRVSYDLTGLPPTPAEVEAFVNDDSKTAREKVVDRLLASEQFGVHWGRHWLDVARYADSNGCDFNATHYNAWRYRNYVVSSFNRDKPYDQFVREQLAGDLMPFDDDHQKSEQLIATGFLMIGPKMLSERDKTKLYMDVVDEQIDTVGRVFMGMTMGCARCHDHKFDPIPTEDYYAMAGIFTSTETLRGESQQFVSTWREVELPMAKAHADAIAKYNESKSDLEGRLKKAKEDLKTAELEKPTAKDGSILIDNEAAKFTGSWSPSKYRPKHIGKGYVHDGNKDKGKSTALFTWKVEVSGEYDVQFAHPGGGGLPSDIPATLTHANGKSELKIDESTEPTIDGQFISLGKFDFDAKQEGSLLISNKGTVGHLIVDAVRLVPAKGLVPVVEAPVDDEAEATVAKLKDEIKSLEAELKNLKDSAPEPAPTAMAVRENDKIDDCAICIRGEVHNRGPVVERGFIQVASTGPARIKPKDQSGRLELADWVARDDHPLTARVMVNRIWRHMLGVGIVKSVDNFGELGTRPTHPELLDVLSLDFIEGGWSVKKMVRRIALSRVYGLSSHHNDHAYDADPENKLLWRSNRKRLTAESMRDTMLMVADNLDYSTLESPVKGMGRLAINNSSSSSSGKDDKGTSRSIYLPVIRNDISEFLKVFDFADPDMVTGDRPTTNVPAQSLMLMNSPFVRNSAKSTAARVIEANEESADRITGLYNLVFSRSPSTQEVERAMNYINSFVGDSSDKQRVEQAWTNLCQVLFASTEFRFLN